jgi:hypothetical protein
VELVEVIGIFGLTATLAGGRPGLPAVSAAPVRAAARPAKLAKAEPITAESRPDQAKSKETL